TAKQIEVVRRRGAPGSASNHVECVPLRVDLDGDGADARTDRLDDVVHDGAVQAFLTAEVVRDQRLIRAGLSGDGLRRRSVEAVPPEDPRRGLEQRLARAFAADREPAGRAVHVAIFKRPFKIVKRTIKSWTAATT